MASDLAHRFPRGHGKISDQLTRAAFSIPLNIAEGYGKRSEADRRPFGGRFRPLLSLDRSCGPPFGMASPHLRLTPGP